VFSAKADRDQVLEAGSLQKVAALADSLPLRTVIGQSSATINIRKITE